MVLTDACAGEGGSGARKERAVSRQEEKQVEAPALAQLSGCEPELLPPRGSGTGACAAGGSALSELPQVRLKIRRRSEHAWVYQKMVEKPRQRLSPGSVVEVWDREGQWVGRGFYNGHSRIRLRLLTTDPAEQIDADFFARRLARAIAWRRDVLRLDAITDAYRLVFSEGDELSGLVVDRFGPVLVLEFFAAGMYRWRAVIQDILSRYYPECTFYWFAEEHIQKQESFDCRSPAPPPPVVIQEHGVRFRVCVGSKHKTGFFLDQRDNRRLLASFCAGRRVLDLCCNSGGFALYAKVLGGAAEVVGVDLDEQALALARVNAQLNQVRIRFVQADLFPWLRDALAHGQRFDVVVLDPSKQTRDRDSVARALQRYVDMNRLAIQAVVPGGILLTCSCTGLVREEDFLAALRRAAAQAGRTLQVFYLGGAASDHPYLLHVPEGRYLKAVFCRVL
jgi:23S rRNA (cytosine1962-C5)-methyltransferase